MLDFSTEALIRAMHVPIDDVITRFKLEQFQKLHIQQQQEDFDKTNDIYWTTEEAQGNFASILYTIIEPIKQSHRFLYQKTHVRNSDEHNDVTDDHHEQLIFKPTIRYIRKLMQRYAYMIESKSSKQIENDDLAQLIMEYQFRSRMHKTFCNSNSSSHDDTLPNPYESCHVSYILQHNTRYSSKSCDNIDCATNNNGIVGIKIYPHHNDVGVRKVWEAGAALAEYLIQNPHFVQNRSVCELGAGVGLTGIVIAGLCDTKSVHMTDYTDCTLENLEYNCVINYDWVVESRNSNENYLVENKVQSDINDTIITTVSLKVPNESKKDAQAGSTRYLYYESRSLKKCLN